MKKKLFTGTPSEKRVGYARARAGKKRLYTSGTLASNEQGEIIGDTLYEQCVCIFQKLDAVITQAGFSRKDVVIVRAYLVSLQDMAQFDQAFKKFFEDIHPCSTVVGASWLAAPEALLEVEWIAEKE